ncbi:hypothetical protein [uncultured Thioclava sp.]|uniref:hypothetical protein n=1 Tax=uncultured Thioclava sp. TaxID=473858 RepID=UPI0025E37BD9|nr:hypothetical protein [uncultured Thioclava sp.]
MKPPGIGTPSGVGVTFAVAEGADSGLGATLLPTAGALGGAKGVAVKGGRLLGASGAIAAVCVSALGGTVSFVTGASGADWVSGATWLVTDGALGAF